MEIVKKLKGSEDENENFDFEEVNLYQEEKNTKKKRKILLPLLAVIGITAIGYFGFKQLQTNTTQKIQEDNIVTTINTNKTLTENNTPSQIISKKEKAIIKKEEVIVYTEVLALSHKETTSKTTIEKPIIKTISKPIIKEEKAKIIISQPVKIKQVLRKKIAKKQIVSIKKGDTLAVLAKRYYGNSLAFQSIITANRSIKDHKSKLKIGQKIIIPAHGKVQKPKIVSKKIKTVKKKILRARTIKVKRGDTLAVLAKRYYGNSLAFQGIIRANKSIKSHKTSLKLGQKILIPAKGSTKKVKTVPKKPKYKKRIVTVKKGYSLAYMAKKYYGSTSKIQKIVNANKSIKNKNSTLRIGQKVYLPR